MSRSHRDEAAMRPFLKLLPLSALAALALMPFASSAAQPAAPPKKGSPPPAPPLAPSAAAFARPAGSMLRCKDGHWAPATSPNSWCVPHGGVLVRFHENKPVPAPKARPEKKSLVETPAPPAFTRRPASTAMSAVKAPAAPTMPPPPGPKTTGHTLMCKDGTLLSGPQDKTRCDSHGGVDLIFPVPQTRKRP